MISEETYNNLVNNFKRTLISERRSPRTVKQYAFLYSKFLKYVNKEPVECTQQDIEKFKFFLATSKAYSKASQYLAIQAVKCAFRTLEVAVPKNLTPPKRSRKMPVFLSPKESAMLIKASGKNLQVRIIISTLLYSGIRVSELCNMKTEDINFDEGSIIIHGGKGDKERVVLVPSEVSELMKNYHMEMIEKEKISEYLLISQKGGKFDTSTIERVVKKVAQEAGIRRRVTPHTLRHTFATNILRNGGDIRFIQTLLGHANIGTTEIYTHIDSEAMREMFRKFGPKYTDEDM